MYLGEVCTRGDVRLRGGMSHRSRVELCYEKTGWVTICDDNWSLAEGHVVCGQLGFYRAGIYL